MFKRENMKRNKVRIFLCFNPTPPQMDGTRRDTCKVESAEKSMFQAAVPVMCPVTTKGKYGSRIDIFGPRPLLNGHVTLPISVVCV